MTFVSFYSPYAPCLPTATQVRRSSKLVSLLAVAFLFASTLLSFSRRLLRRLSSLGGLSVSHFSNSSTYLSCSLSICASSAMNSASSPAHQNSRPQRIIRTQNKHNHINISSSSCISSVQAFLLGLQDDLGHQDRTIGHQDRTI